MLKKNKSINFLIKDVFYWNTHLGNLLLTGLVTAITIWFLWSDQKTGMTVTLSLYNQYSNSISRELELGNPLVAKANFEAFIKELNVVGITNNLILNILPATEYTSSNEVYYSINIFSSSLKIPLKFSSTVNGTISGSISYFPSLLALFALWIIMLFLIVTLKRIESGIKLKLEKEIINPITTLSLGKSLDNTSEYSDEVNNINNNIISLKQKIVSSQQIENEILRSQQINLLASQVSHDVRSPLAALNMIMGQLTQVPEHQRLIIRSSVNRINDIANTLLQKSKEQISQTKVNTNITDQHNFQVELLPALIDSLVSEKRVQFRDKFGIEIEGDFKESYGTFAKIDSTELKRTISNLVNNSVDAFSEGKGRVTVSVGRKEENVVISIQDNGKGIPAHILAKLGELGVTHGKEGTESGSGLGVYHAKRTIESFGGKFEIKSQLGIGTNIQLIFPSAPAPKWFVEKLNISLNTKVIALDDDASIHGIWKGRFESASTIKDGKIFLLNFTSGSEFKTWFSTNHSNDVLFLFDYELLAQPQTGLDIIEELGIGNKSILITSRYEEPQLRNRCEKLGVKLIPKGMASLIPIEIEKPKELFHLALIDDDIDLVHYVWNYCANEKGVKIKTFSTPNQFFEFSKSMDINTPVYIDVSLGNGVKGQDVALDVFGTVKLRASEL